MIIGLEFLKAYGLKLFGLLAALAALWLGYHEIDQHGYQRCKAEWDKEKSDQAKAEAAALLTRVKNNERIVEQQAIDNQKIQKGHQDEIASIHAAYAKSGRLRINAANLCSGPPATAQAEGTSRGNGTDAGTRILPEAVDRDFKQFGEMIEGKFASCRAAQAFIKANGMSP